MFEYVNGAGDGQGDGVDESWGPRLDGTPRVQWWTNGEEEPWVAHPNNVRDFFETGLVTNNNVAVSGNFDDTNFRLSYTNMQQGGVMPNSGLERNNISLNAGAQFSDRLRAEGRVNYIQTIGKNRPDVGYSAENPMQQLTQWFGRQVDINKLRDYTKEDGTPRNWNYNYHDNPFWQQYENTNRQDRNRIIGNASVTYDLTDWLSVRGRSGTDWYHEQRQNQRAVGTLNDPDGLFEEEVFYVREWTNTVQVNAVRDLTSSVSLDASVFAENWSRRVERNYGQAPALSIPNVYNLENSKVRQLVDDRTFMQERNSLFGRATVGYNDYLFLDLTARNDWSSTLPTDNNSYFYPSASLSFVFSDVFEVGDWLSYGKLRGGWSQVGSATDPYQLQAVYEANEFLGLPNFTVDNVIPNTELKPEITTSWEIGAELRFMNGRLGLDATYYDELTEDQIFGVTVSSASGFDEKVLNAGAISNRGVEAVVSVAPILTEDFAWDLSFNFSKNVSKVESLTGDVESIILADTWDVTVEAREGEEFGILYGYGYLRDDDGNIVVDDNGVPMTDFSEKKSFGSYQPDWRGSVYSSLNYKGIGLDVLVDVKRGGRLSSVTYMFGRYTGILEETLNGRLPGTEFVFDGVKQDGSPNDIPINMSNVVDFNHHTFGNVESHSFDASYAKLREVRLSYDLPSNWLSRTPLRRATLALVGRNLWIMHSNVPHIDPETAFSSDTTPGLESNQLPSVRTFGFNVNVTL